MRCPDCKGASYVSDSRHRKRNIRRTRVCKNCGKRFQTMEEYRFIWEGSIASYKKRLMAEPAATQKTHPLIDRAMDSVPQANHARPVGAKVLDRR